MPMLDAYIPEGALSPNAERELLAKITDLLLEHEGVDPSNERARPLAWVFVHRTEVYVAGAPPKSPRYRFICQVPEGQYDDERRAAVTAAMTQAAAEAERGAWPHPELERSQHQRALRRAVTLLVASVILKEGARLGRWPPQEPGAAVTASAAALDVVPTMRSTLSSA